MKKWRSSPQLAIFQTGSAADFKTKKSTFQTAQNSDKCGKFIMLKKFRKKP